MNRRRRLFQVRYRWREGRRRRKGRTVFAAPSRAQARETFTTLFPHVTITSIKS